LRRIVVAVVVEHPTGLMSEKHHAFAEKVASYTAVIINKARTRGRSATGQNIEEEGVGVGSGCIWNGRKLILTAKHVVEGATPLSLAFS
jgi:S1-C subfamily serine protease